MARPLNLLITGLNMPASARYSPGAPIAALESMLQNSIAALSQFPNVSVTRFQIDPDAAPTSEESVAAWQKVVKDGPAGGSSSESSKWDAHMIGTGVKIIAELTPVFEDLVNYVAVHGKGETRALFLEKPSAHVECVKRWLAKVEGEKL